jgi:hypothetical protein
LQRDRRDRLYSPLAHVAAQSAAGTANPSIPYDLIPSGVYAILSVGRLCSVLDSRHSLRVLVLPTDIPGLTTWELSQHFWAFFSYSRLLLGKEGL